MDNYDLSNLPLLGDCADSAESHPWLTAEQNARATFSGRSATAGTPEQAELQQLSLTYEEQLSEQRVLADFDISLLPSTRDRASSDGPEDPFTALATYQPLAFDDNSQHPSYSELGPGSGFLEGFTAQDPTHVVMAELEGNDFLELSVQSEQLDPPEQSQGESDTQSIIIPESATPDTVSDKHSDKRREVEPRSVLIRGIPKSSIEHSVEMHLQKSLCGSERLTKTRKEPNSKKTKTRSQSAAMRETSATCKRKTRISSDKSLCDRVEQETQKYTLLIEGPGDRYLCGFPNCGVTRSQIRYLRRHIFKHIQISRYKCNYPECGDNAYFRDSAALKRHWETLHTNEKPYSCVLCKKSFNRLDSYKRHVSQRHKTKS